MISKKTGDKRITLSDVIGAYKSIVANRCLMLHKQNFLGKPYTPLLGKIWHRSFDDRIIRDDRAYNAISLYILNNPKNWTRSRK